MQKRKLFHTFRTLFHIYKDRLMIKKYFFILLLSLSFSTISLGQDIVIVGIIDGPLPGGLPKAMELYVVNDIADLSVYGLEKAANGAASSGQTYTFPQHSKVAGEFIHIATETPLFNQYFGADPTYEITTGELNFNGDDVVILYSNGTISDVIGEVGVDGSGTAWEYLDGWALRNSGTGPNATFTISEWTFSGKNALDGCDLTDDSGTNEGCGSVYPAETYSTTGTASVKEKQINGFTTFPNPINNGYLTVKTSSTLEKEVLIYNVLGKQVFTHKFKGTSKLLDISNIGTGIYIMKVIEGDKIATKKLVIR